MILRRDQFLYLVCTKRFHRAILFYSNLLTTVIDPSHLVLLLFSTRFHAEFTEAVSRV